MTTRQYVWVFDSNKCVCFGHRAGCQAIKVSPTTQVKGSAHYMGVAATSDELDDMGHPAKLCKCTK